MADREKTTEKGFLARTASITSKRAKRAGEKVKQKLGKANETKDVTFDEFVANFNRQQAAAQRLQKDFKNYNSCIKAMVAASQEFGEAIKEVYEPDWAGRDVTFQLLDKLHLYWADLQEKLQDEVLGPLTAYQSQFPDIKARINKHGRKLVDYDRLRHNFEALNAKGKNADQKKLSQSQEEFSEAKSVYTKLHAELYEELPALYDSRIAFYVSSFQSIFNAEAVFHREAAKIKTQMNDLLDGLVVEASSGTHTTRRPFQLSSLKSISDSGDEEQLSNSGQTDSQQGSLALSTDKEVKADDSETDKPPNETEEEVTAVVNTNDSQTEEDNQQTEAKPDLPPPYTTTDEQDGAPSQPVVRPTPAPRPPPPQQKTEPVNDTSTITEVPGSLYKVQATHKYDAEDDDELSFEKNDVIFVIPFDDAEEQDDGWLLGVIATSGLKGVFPANFTKEIT